MRGPLIRPDAASQSRDRSPKIVSNDQEESLTCLQERTALPYIGFIATARPIYAHRLVHRGILLSSGCWPDLSCGVCRRRPSPGNASSRLQRYIAPPHPFLEQRAIAPVVEAYSSLYDGLFMEFCRSPLTLPPRDRPPPLPARKHSLHFT